MTASHYCAACRCDHTSQTCNDCRIYQQRLLACEQERFETKQALAKSEKERERLNALLDEREVAAGIGDGVNWKARCESAENDCAKLRLSGQQGSRVARTTPA